MRDLTLSLLVTEVDDLKNGKEDGGSAFMAPSVWQHMPQELVETVLLLLPPSSQARFCVVCKRWRELIKSAAFQEETSALQTAHLLCFLRPPGLNLPPLRLPKELSTKSLKAHKLQVDMPGWVIPSDLSMDTFCHGGEGLVAVTAWHRNALAQVMRCWLLNIVDRSWRELPGLVPLAPVDGQTWNVWVAGINTNNCQVSVIMSTGSPHRNTLYTCSATSTTWGTVDIPGVQLGVQLDLCLWRCAVSKLGYVLVDSENRLWLWEGTSSAKPPTPLPSEWDIQAVSHPDTDVVFGYSWIGELNMFRLFRLDGSSSGQWKWKCVVTGLPQGCVPEGCNAFVIHRAIIVGSKVLIEVCLSKKDPGYCSFAGSLFLTYHILTGCYEWLTAFSDQEFNLPSRSNLWAELELMDPDPAAFFKHDEQSNINKLQYKK